MAVNNPGKKWFLKNASDLSPAAFRRHVARRARQLLGDDVASPTTEDERRELEEAIKLDAEKIHLEADFLPARFLADGARRARAVCRIDIRTPRGSGFGTGFLVAPGVLMTNHHVLESPAVAGQSLAEFGFEEGMNPALAALRPERLFLTDEELDFTLVACDADDLGDLEPIPLRREPAAVTRFERVSIIQHPAGRPKEVALHDNRVERVLDRVIRYRTDTEPGSSGSPVFNRDWELVALHHAGVAEDGGTAINEGVRISAIVAHLLGLRPAAGGQDEALRAILGETLETSPYLGFFDWAGLGDPASREVEVPDFTGSRDFADVGVWNIEHFNDAIADRRVDDVAEVVARLSMDVLGLVEVERGALERLTAKLAERGFSVGFELTDVPGSQDLAVLFDRDTTTLRLRDDLAERYADQLAAQTASGRTAFPRRPLFAECRIDGGDDTEVAFLLLVLHLKAFGDAESRARRRLAAEKLAEIVDDLRHREGLPVVVGGDFNETLANDTLAPLTDAPDLFTLTADDAATDAISFVGSSHRSLIDHLVVSRDVALGEISGDDAAIVRLDRSVSDFSDRVSDHVPIVVRMVFREAAAVDREEPAREDRGHVVRIPIPAGTGGLRLEFRAAGGG